VIEIARAFLFARARHGRLDLSFAADGAIRHYQPGNVRRILLARAVILRGNMPFHNGHRYRAE
jgi:hypothetical protein